MRQTYRTQYRPRYRQPRKKPKLKLIVLAVMLIAVAFLSYRLLAPTPVEKAVDSLKFDASVSETEKQTIRQAIRDQALTYSGSLDVSVQTVSQSSGAGSILSAYLPVTNFYSTRQTLGKADVGSFTIYVPEQMDQVARQGVADFLGVAVEQLNTLNSSIEELGVTDVALVLPSELSPSAKLLAFENGYFLDDFKSGAIIRQAVFSGADSAALDGIVLNHGIGQHEVLKINMTGVTALTRVMMQKLSSVGMATYFSDKIGAFLADADITHVSNEVSFKEGCEFSRAVFCSPPAMIEALKASGVDLVELTGNHNNDTGSQFNTETINLYHSLGWGTFGGGLNSAEAAKPFVADQKGSKVAFLGYNYADSPNSGAIATSNSAGANSFDINRVESDIASARQQADFVIVDVQFWECYSYPDGYVEFPECDRPIGQQASVFRQIIDLGADMVVGTQAHQPQTYEIYQNKPIYYGLGNLYFDQTQWPGTERGIVLTHYFASGRLLQTKLSPTVFDASLQTQLMENDAAEYLLDRLNSARPYIQ